MSDFFSDNISFHLDIPDFNLKNISGLVEWVNSCIKSKGLIAGDIAFSFVSDDALLDLNKKHLNHDYFTDILTFEYNENDLVSGDLIISIDRVGENAEQLGLSFSDELHRVMIHGILHLCGYKDKDPEDQAIMKSQEDYYLSLRSF